MTDRLPVAKALAVLEALNRRPVMKLADIAATAGLPKPTAVRLLSDLCQAGYAERISRSAGYRLTSKVLGLSRGFDARERLVEAAAAPMRAFTAAEKWPVTIAVREGTDMVLRYSTVAHSPMAIDPDVVHVTSPILLSAVGRAFLAFCSTAEHDEILGQLRRSRRNVDAIARDDALVARLLAGVRRRGYASTDDRLRRMTTHLPRQYRDARQRGMGFAVPVLQDGDAVASLTMRYFDTLMSPEEAARRYLKPLKELARTVAEAGASSTDR